MTCMGHTNDFQHFDCKIAEAFDLGIKMRDDPAPPCHSEPVLYLYVSVTEIPSGNHLEGSIVYARSRTFLGNRYPSSTDDRERLKSDVILLRLANDIRQFSDGTLKTSDKNPIFMNHT